MEANQPGISRGGAIVDEQGKTIGQHAGVHRFTIGQRKGLGIAAPAPLYVLKLEPDTRNVVVGARASLERTKLEASGVNWIACEAPANWTPVTAQIRHRHAAAPARVRALAGDRAELEFDTPQAAITPGQAVVFYDGEAVVGGGWID